MVCFITALICSCITAEEHFGTREQTANVAFELFKNKATSIHESHTNISGERLEGPV